MPLKDNLRALLDEKDMKPAELARKSGVSEAMISYYLSGKREPMGKTCFKLATALDVSVDQLLRGPLSNSEKEKPAAGEGDEPDGSKKEIISKLYQLNLSELRLVEKIVDSVLSERDSLDI